jgi:hypothetical protein
MASATLKKQSSSDQTCEFNCKILENEKRKKKIPTNKEKYSENSMQY